MCTGKKFEIRFCVVLGFDSEDDAKDAAEIFRTVTNAVSATSGAPGGSKCDLLKRAPSSDPKAN